MPVLNDIKEMRPEIQRWRRHLHANPETAFNERQTASFIADKLKSFGLEVFLEVGRTGVVGVLERGDGKSIGLRADMDALAMNEENSFSHCSQNPGVMHACGHDGHMAMLLGAADYLSSKADFSGKVVFIFQPAEENEGGAGYMIEDGLFEKFSVDAVFGLHNMPGVPLGTFACRPGPIMASFAAFDIIVQGTGAHAAMPHEGTDTVVAAASLITEMQSIVSRSVRALEPAVLSFTKLRGGSTHNIIPDTVEVSGTVRTFSSETEDLVRKRMQAICEGISLSMGVSVSLNFDGSYPSTVNSPDETSLALEAAREVAGDDGVIDSMEPLMGSEDFSLMLQQRPGAYMILGAGEGSDVPRLHQPCFDFNDDLLVSGVSWWVRLVELFLGK